MLLTFFQKGKCHTPGDTDSKDWRGEFKTCACEAKQTNPITCCIKIRLPLKTPRGDNLESVAWFPFQCQANLLRVCDSIAKKKGKSSVLVTDKLH